MNAFPKFLFVAAAAVGAFATVSTAHARTDVVVSIGFQQPVRYVQPAPVYVQPRPVYVQHQPVYHAPVHSRGRGGAWGDADRDGVANVYDRDSRFYDRRAARQFRRDADHDGVANRFDRAPHNPYRY
jgi:hypothetical protein